MQSTQKSVVSDVKTPTKSMVKLINRIFEIKGDSRRVRSLSQDLADGSKFIP